MAKQNQTPELGDKVKCKITGFTGVVTSYAKCLTGCDRITVQPPVGKDGKHPDAMWFDAAAVEVLVKAVVKPQSVQEKNNPGGPATKAERRSV